MEKGHASLGRISSSVAVEWERRSRLPAQLHNTFSGYCIGTDAERGIGEFSTFFYICATGSIGGSSPASSGRRKSTLYIIPPPSSPTPFHWLGLSSPSPNCHRRDIRFSDYMATKAKVYGMESNDPIQWIRSKTRAISAVLLTHSVTNVCVATYFVLFSIWQDGRQSRVSSVCSHRNR